MGDVWIENCAASDPVIDSAGGAPANALVLVSVATSCAPLPTPTVPKASAAGDAENAATPPVPVSGIEASTTPWLSDMTRLAALPPPDVGENSTNIAQALPPESEVSAVHGTVPMCGDVCSENCVASVPVIDRTGVAPANAAVLVTVATSCAPLPTPTLPKAIAAGESENAATPPVPVSGIEASTTPWLSDMTRLAALPPPDVGENSTNIAQALPPESEVSAVQGTLPICGDVTSENCAASAPMIVKTGVAPGNALVFVTVATLSPLLPTPTVPASIAVGVSENVATPPVPVIGTEANGVPLLSDITKLDCLPPADVGENSTSMAQAAPLASEVSAVQGGLPVKADVTSEN